jgi:hypothetical protein
LIAPRAVLRLFVAIAVALVLTALTQVGGVVLLLALGLGSRLPWRGVKRSVALTSIFVVLYAASGVLLAPPLAGLGGRVPLPCFGEPLRSLPVLCVLNRHYASPELRTLAEALALDLDREFPGTVTVALDANFPFLDGFPLLPHLSHDDGDKLDLSFFYADPSGAYLPGVIRSPIGYWAFETPDRGEETQCSSDGPSLRWRMEALQPLFPNLQLEPQRTQFALRWLFTKGPAYGLQRVFLEPYVARRLEVSSPLLGFQGCRAARHDDHIHLQIH